MVSVLFSIVIHYILQPVLAELGASRCSLLRRLVGTSRASYAFVASFVVASEIRSFARLFVLAIFSIATFLIVVLIWVHFLVYS